MGPNVVTPQGSDEGKKKEMDRSKNTEEGFERLENQRGQEETLNFIIFIAKYVSEQEGIQIKQTQEKKNLPLVIQSTLHIKSKPTQISKTKNP